MDQNTLEGKVCVVTGGGSGMGQALARKLGEEGAKVAILGRTANKIDSLVDELKTNRVEARGFAVDVGDRNAVFAAAEEIRSKLGNVTVLVNGAGHSSLNRGLLETSEDVMLQVLRSNLLGTIFCTQAFLPMMLEVRTGSVINISSRSATHPGLLGGMIYCAAKAGVSNFTMFLREEFKNSGIRFCCVVPGEVNTPVLDKRRVPPSDEAKATMIPAEAAADAIVALLRLPQSTSIPEIQMLPTMLRDFSAELTK